MNPSIILTMDKAIVYDTVSYIIPYRIVFTIIYGKYKIQDTFLLNYNLYNCIITKKKFSTTKFFPIKEHKGKSVVKFKNNLNSDPVVIRNYIRSIYFLLTKICNTIPCWYVNDANDLNWVINKYVASSMLPEPHFNVRSMMLNYKLPIGDYSATEINNMIINYCNTESSNNQITTMHNTFNIEKIIDILENYKYIININNT